MPSIQAYRTSGKARNNGAFLSDDEFNTFRQQQKDIEGRQAGYAARQSNTASAAEAEWNKKKHSASENQQFFFDPNSAYGKAKAADYAANEALKNSDEYQAFLRDQAKFNQEWFTDAPTPVQGVAAPVVQQAQQESPSMAGLGGVARGRSEGRLADRPTPIDANQGVRTLPASSRALAGVVARAGRVY